MLLKGKLWLNNTWWRKYRDLREESSILSWEIDLFQYELGRGDIFLVDEGVENCSSGDIPNLYAQEDMDTITTACKALATQAGLAPTKVNIFR